MPLKRVIGPSILYVHYKGGNIRAGAARMSSLMVARGGSCGVFMFNAFYDLFLFMICSLDNL